MTFTTHSASDFYDRIFGWAWACVERVGPTCLIGVNGPQGSGKTTLTSALCERFEGRGRRAVSISIDDFYLTHAEQRALAARNPTNPFLQQRGYPGTHDVELGARVLAALKRGEPSVFVPRYDKSLHHGRGDRLPESGWTRLQGRVDVVFLEGWMLGFSPVGAGVLSDPSLLEIDRLLVEYEKWTSQLDGFLQLSPLDLSYVSDWRAEAEQKMRASGRGGMSEAEIRAYVATFLPAYESYLPQLDLCPPALKSRLKIKVGKNRLPAPMEINVHV